MLAWQLSTAVCCEWNWEGRLCRGCNSCLWCWPQRPLTPGMRPRESCRSAASLPCCTYLNAPSSSCRGLVAVRAIGEEGRIKQRRKGASPCGAWRKTSFPVAHPCSRRRIRTAASSRQRGKRTEYVTVTTCPNLTPDDGQFPRSK